MGLVERIAGDHHIAHPVQRTVATTDGEAVWVFRYASERRTRSLFFSTEVAKVRALYPEVEVLHQLGPEARFVVSEPLRDLPGAWNEMPESSAGVVRPDQPRSIRFGPLEPV